MFKRKAPNCINLFRFVRNEMQEPVQRWKRVWALGSLFNSTKSLLMGNNLLQAIKGLLVSINVFYPSMSYYFNVYVHTCIHTHIYIYMYKHICLFIYNVRIIMRSLRSSQTLLRPCIHTGQVGFHQLLQCQTSWHWLIPTFNPLSSFLLPIAPLPLLLSPPPFPQLGQRELLF